MADYRVAWGHDVAHDDMDKITPEPKVDLVAPVQTNYGASGKRHSQGLFARYTWSHVEDDTEYQDLIDQFNVLQYDSSPVTINVRNHNMFWRRYNGTAHKPEPNTDVKKDGFFPQNIVLFVTDLREIA